MLYNKFESDTWGNKQQLDLFNWDMHFVGSPLVRLRFEVYSPTLYCNRNC